MTPEDAKALRAPFPAELIGKLPRIWCGACRDARSKVCSQHTKSRCTECQNNLTAAHLHLDYVGHADTTDRLLQVDPGWTWEPAGVDEHGLPILDANGGLWLKLTVCGVTRLGYGHPDGKRGGDAVKEAIGDAIRNAALRYGVALDLWRKERPPIDDGGEAKRPARTRKSAADRPDANPAGHPDDDPQRRVKRMFALYNEEGPEGRDERLADLAEILGRPVGSSKELSPEDVETVISALVKRQRARLAGQGASDA